MDYQVYYGHFVHPFYVVYREQMMFQMHFIFFLSHCDCPFSDHCKRLYFDGSAGHCNTLQRRLLYNVFIKSLCLFQGATAEHTGPLTSANPQRCFYQNKTMRFTILVESLVKHNAHGPIQVNKKKTFLCIMNALYHSRFI